MNRLFAIASCFLAFACNETQPDQGAAPSLEAPAGAEAAAKRAALIPCEAAQGAVDAEGNWVLPDCRSMFTDESGLAFEARYMPIAPGESRLKLQIFGPGDAPMQTIEEVMDGGHGAPRSQDLDKDGRADLLIPRSQGVANSLDAVWLQREDGVFARAGELFGIDFQLNENGYVVAPSRASASSWTLAYVRIEEGRLAPQASVDVTAAMAEDGTILGFACSLTKDAPLAPGPSPEAAELKFCAEPQSIHIFAPPPALEPEATAAPPIASDAPDIQAPSP